MLRWLLYVVLALWVGRLVRMMLPGGPGRRMSGFDPGAGAPHPPAGGEGAGDAVFEPSEIVDGEFEDVPGPRQP